MATAESHVSAMQQQRSEHANIQSVTQLFRQRAGIDAQRTAARRKVSGRWQDVTWAQLAKEAEETGWGLIAIGVKRGDMVSIIAGTRVEWTVADLGVAAAGAITVPIYQSNTPDECQFILENAGAVMVFVEDQKQLAKLRQLRGRLPKIHHLVLLEGEGDGEWVLSLEQLNARGREHRGRAPRELEERIQSQTRNDLSTLLYTSGTTGASEVAVGTRLLAREDSHLLFLPFAHSFAQIIKAAWFGSGLTMIFAESVDKLVDNAGETSPTILSAVPRVYEKAYNSVVASGMANPGLQGVLFRTAMREFELYAKAKANGQAYNSLAFTVAKKLVFPKVRDKLRKRFGGRITKFVSGGAPLAKKIAYFFDLLGFDMLEGYGLTETIAVTSVNLPGQNKLGTVGRPFPGVEVKIAEDCEILMRGRNIMRGYFGLPGRISQDHRPQEGPDQDQRRQVHRAAVDRRRAEDGQPADQPGGRDRRPSQVRIRAGDGGRGGGEEAERREQLCRGDAQPGGAAGGPGGDRQGQRHAAFVRDDQTVHHPGPRLLAGDRRAHADAQGQAQAGHAEIQEGDRRDV